MVISAGWFCKLVAAICFLLVALSVSIGGLQLIPIGLFFLALGFLIP